MQSAVFRFFCGYPIVLVSSASHLFSFDYLLRSRHHVGWDRQPQLLGGLEIDREFNILDRLDLEIFGMSPAQNFLDVLGGKPPRSHSSSGRSSRVRRWRPYFARGT